MLNKIRNREKGFTLIELLIVVAIIGIIAALLIPNFLDALQKARQKRTVADERTTGQAFFSLLTDIGSAAAAGQVTTQYDLTKGQMAKVDRSDVEELLVTRYIQLVPNLDGWKNPYEYHMGQSVTSPQLFAIRSFGLRGAEGPGMSNPYVVTSFTPTDYEQDIVWADGTFVRWPESAQKAKLR